jgi:PAS domain S-box-containing protein
MKELKPTAEAAADTSAAMMATGFMTELVATTSLGELGRKLTEQVRELAGARAVLLLESIASPTMCRLLEACPPHRADLFNAHELTSFCTYFRKEGNGQKTIDAISDNAIRNMLAEKRVESVMFIPLPANGKQVGTLVLLNLPGANRGEELWEVLNMLAPFFGVAMQNIFNQEEIRKQADLLEQQIAVRTLDLEQAQRAALNMMEDAVLAKQAIAESEQRYRLLFQNMPSGFALHEMIYDDQGNAIDCRYLQVNQAFTELTGLAGELAVGRTVKDLLPNIENHWIEPYAAVVKTGDPLNIENYSEDIGKYFEVRAFRAAPGQFATVFTDVTEQKRLQEALEERIIALTRPLDDLSAEMSFEDLFKLDEFQRIQDEFSSATGVASIITDTAGSPITEPSNFTRLCFDIIRKTEKGCANCFKSDATLGRHNPHGPIIQPCLSGGLWDAGVNINIGDKHIANWLIGQVRNDTQTDETMRAYAREIGADETEFMDAFNDVPVMPQAQFEAVAQALFTLVKQLTTSAYQNMQQARFIADQKKAEDDLRELNAVQSLILNSSTLGIALIEDRLFKWVNPRLCELFGLDEEGLTGASTRILYATEEEFAETGRAAYAALGRGERFDHVIEFQRRDGSLFWGRLIGNALDPEHAKDRGSLWMFEDISDRVKAENELLRLSAAIEQSPETVVITDQDGTIVYANPAFETATGYRVEEAIGQTPNVLKSGKHDEAFYADLWKTISAGHIWEGRIENKRKDGSLYTEEASIAPVRDSAGLIINYVAVKRDITEELVREEEFRQVQKMDAVGQLASGVAHDYNNILQGIQGFSELLQMTLDKNSQEHKNAVEIHKAATRAGKLTQKILTFSRKHPNQLIEVDLNAAIVDAEALLHILLGDVFELSLDLDEDLAPITADQNQLSQIIMNLSVNARDAMPKGGHLSISTQQVRFTEKDVSHLTNGRPGDFACLAVTDSGTGMDAETLDRIFDPFFTTKEVGSGTGLGLSVIYGIVKQCNGWINVYSELGQGTSFRIYFPLHKPPEKASGAMPQTPAARILFVDDNPEVASMAIEVLSGVGYHPLAATSAEDALKLFNDQHGQFDLLMSDMVLPGMDGSQLADAIRKINPALPVMLFSGYSDHAKRWKHIKETDYLFVSKPFTTDQLVDTVYQLLKK